MARLLFIDTDLYSTAKLEFLLPGCLNWLGFFGFGSGSDINSDTYLIYNCSNIFSTFSNCGRDILVVYINNSLSSPRASLHQRPRRYIVLFPV